MLNSIGPVWDGNEVWLVTFGGALFAAFPVAYAAVLSGMYLPVMLLLAAIVGRAVSIEFRSKLASPWWRGYWDVSFALSSTLATFLMGVALGNVMRGLPVGPDTELRATVVELLHPYALGVGALAVVGSAMHGATYLLLKTDGELRARVERWAWTSFGLFLVGYVLLTIATLVALPHAIRNFERWPAAWLVVVLNVLALANVPRALALRRPLQAFASSAATIAALVFLVGMALYPNLVPSRLDPAWSLDIARSASSPRTLWLMLVIAAIGMPLVASYTAIVYWVFRGTTQVGKHSY
jgi:cytochrome d ubiquinol oxidase subunit II